MKIKLILFSLLLSGALLVYVFAVHAQQTGNSQKMNIQIDNKTFTVIVENNKTVKELYQKLPITLEMSDLNNNEKYCYLDFTLPTDSKSVKNIKKGDVMLFGNSCLVIFYKSFTTSYSYTKIGHIENPADIETALGRKDIKVILTENN
ncbi:MAG: hypothetical protein IKN62_05035 [Elusimicrobia bacterium]|nr:hypothetical protein [Elusimicrobiota bacterium]